MLNEALNKYDNLVLARDLNIDILIGLKLGLRLR